MSLYSALLPELFTVNSQCMIQKVLRDCMMRFHSQGSPHKTGSMIRKRNGEAAASALFPTPGQAADAAIL